jgi:hypothetical protein
MRAPCWSGNFSGTVVRQVGETEGLQAYVKDKRMFFLDRRVVCVCGRGGCNRD